jgi:tryptophanyl-tRNA synthetase
MKGETILTGITTSGTPHLGNYVGAIRPAIELSRQEDVRTYYFLADYHSLIKAQDPAKTKNSTIELAATWMACGLDTERSIFYRQSDVPEILELTWILTCLTSKGLMNRAHAYKAAVDENIAEGEDHDKGVTMGLYCYPILMAADILMFNATKIPVGRDQIQHIEMARDIAQRFNHHYKELFVLPEPFVEERTAVLSGLAGRKMSKSYDNTIPLFCDENRLKNLIKKIKTDSSPPEEPKDPETSPLFQIYRAFASAEQTEEIRERYAKGIGWGEMKQILFETVNENLKEPRAKYDDLMKNPKVIKQTLLDGAAKARRYAVPLIKKVRKAVGAVPFD